MSDTHKVAPDTDFIDVITQQGYGATEKELSEQLRDIVTRVKSTGKPGTLTVQLKITLVKGTNTVKVTDRITTRKPEYDRPAAIFYSDDDGNLLRDDPNQPTIFDLAQVEDPTKQSVDLGDGKPQIVDVTTGELKD